MSKTTFVDGVSDLSSAWVNTVYGTGTAGGHTHDGADADGHVHQINLQTEVTGILPTIKYAPPRDHIANLNMTYGVTGAQFMVTIAAGSCADTNVGALLAQTSSTTKIVIASTGTAYSAWVAGSNQGGVAPIAVPAPGVSQWLHCFAIGNSVTSYVMDVGFDTSFTAANLLSGTGYVRYRRIGSVLITNMAGTLTMSKFIQVNDTFLWASTTGRIIYQKDGTAGGTTINDTQTIAAGINNLQCEIIYIARAVPQDVNGTAKIVAYHTSQTYDAGADFDATTNGVYNCSVSGNGESRILSDASGNIKVSSTLYNSVSLTASSYTYIRERGYVDYRGKIL